MKSITSLLFLLAAFAGAAHAETWDFDVYLDDRKIGRHTFTLQQHDDRRELRSRADFTVKVLFIDAYAYKHTASEKWRGDCLQALDANTRENSEVTVVKGRLENDGFIVDSPKGQQSLPACVMTFAYWNPHMLAQRKLLNPQTGEWLDATITAMGKETITVRGQKAAADHFRLIAPKLRIDLWYSPSREWLALQSTTPEGYLISYRLR
jgi:hypothetical protein